MSLPAVKALTFDVFGTVVDWRTSIARELRAALEPAGHEFDWLQLADEWRGGYQPALEQVRSGARPWVTLDVLHHENLVELLAKHDIAELSESEIEELSHAWWRLDPWPDAVEGLSRLKQRFIIATLSNGNIALMVNLAKHGALPWDAILGAEISHSYKEQPITYLGSAEALGLRPDECAMVAAHNDDLVAAGALGFRTMYVNRPAEHGPGQTTDIRALHDFDIAATSLTDLARQLEC
ncbi:haloacid dehalogenase type II [Compostimonas suwonensis]|uniref:2-haloacid dehalogenase n=1 Tax=Compostimonas suwonensis TaxID=1048394 RepID=A0A2M9C379_9MICO|nr:haloacid dehalogenase type II [Compostimonas suwonensis]PJJ64994.1 2-haloacid dehalogenase [Compostimonas suwonensis]